MLTSSIAFRKPECAAKAKNPLDSTKSNFGPAGVPEHQVCTSDGAAGCGGIGIQVSTFAEILDQILDTRNNICERLLAPAARASARWLWDRQCRSLCPRE